MIAKVIKRYPFSLLCTLAIIVLSLAPIGAPEVAQDVPFYDKWAHFVMYGTLALIVWWELCRKESKIETGKIETGKIKPSKLIVLGIIFPIILGILMELGQAYLTTYRSGECMDAIANSTGVLLGSLIAFLTRNK